MHAQKVHFPPVVFFTAVAQSKNQPLDLGELTAGLSSKADLGINRSACLHSAQNDRPKTRPAVCIVFRYRLRLRKGRSLKNNNTLKIIYFLNAPF